MPIQPLSFIPFLAFACIILLGIFTRKGRNVGVGFLYGGKVAEDLGEIARYRVTIGQQSVHLLRCVRSGTEFYVLECRSLAPLSIQYNYIRLDAESLEQINRLVKEGGRVLPLTDVEEDRDDPSD